MVTLEQIEKFGESNNACDLFFAPFKKAIKDGDEKFAWQIVISNMWWLNHFGLNISLDDIPVNTDGKFKIRELTGIVEYNYSLYNGVYHGLQTGYINNILHYMANFKNGIKDGDFLKYDIYGNLIIFAKYKNGKLNGKYREFYSGRRIKSSCIYVDGIQNGVYKRYYKNGKLEFKGFYKNGRLAGEYKTYHKNGKISSHGYHNDFGGLHGEQKIYDNEGELIRIDNFVNGAYNYGTQEKNKTYT